MMSGVQGVREHSSTVEPVPMETILAHMLRMQE
jgi:hypothetical protein